MYCTSKDLSLLGRSICIVCRPIRPVRTESTKNAWDEFSQLVSKPVVLEPIYSFAASYFFCLISLKTLYNDRLIKLKAITCLGVLILLLMITGLGDKSRLTEQLNLDHTCMAEKLTSLLRTPMAGTPNACYLSQFLRDLTRKNPTDADLTPVGWIEFMEAGPDQKSIRAEIQVQLQPSPSSIF